MAELTQADVDAKKLIDQYDLTAIVEDTRKQQNWDEARAKDAERWYKNFLFMCYLDRNHPLLVLGQDADKVWHTHLETSRYRDDCMTLVGAYVNHQPTPGKPPTRQQRADTNERCKKLFDADAPDLLVHCIAPPPPLN